jgi:DNA-binding transcriptional LysR family regulator
MLIDCGMRIPQINLSQLFTFYVVAKKGSFSEAAEDLCITQPAVTMQVKALQNYFGVKLVQVKRKKVLLTKAGETLLLYSEELYQAAIKAESFLHSDRTQQLRIGISSALLSCLTPLMDRFKELHPTTLLVVKEGSSLKAVEELADFQHDICFVAPLEQLSKELVSFRLPNPERLMVIVAPGDSLARGRKITWQELAAHPLILHREGSVLRRMILDEFKKRALMPNVAADIDGMEFIKQLVQAGKGVALMVRQSVEQEVMHRRLKALPLEDGFAVSVDVVMRRETILTPPLNAFLTLLNQSFSCDIKALWSIPDAIRPS